MITEAMVTKGLAFIGSLVVADKVIYPATVWTGTMVGKGFGALVGKLNKNGTRKAKKEKTETKQATEQQILALLKECNEQFSENDTKEEPDNVVTIVEEVKPEPMFDQRMRDWIQKCKDQYGGFERVVLD